MSHSTDIRLKSITYVVFPLKSYRNTLMCPSLKRFSQNINTGSKVSSSTQFHMYLY